MHSFAQSMIGYCRSTADKAKVDAAETRRGAVAALTLPLQRSIKTICCMCCCTCGSLCGAILTAFRFDLKRSSIDLPLKKQQMSAKRKSACHVSSPVQHSIESSLANPRLELMNAIAPIYISLNSYPRRRGYLRGTKTTSSSGMWFRGRGVRVARPFLTARMQVGHAYNA